MREGVQKMGKASLKKKEGLIGDIGCFHRLSKYFLEDIIKMQGYKSLENFIYMFADMNLTLKPNLVLVISEGIHIYVDNMYITNCYVQNKLQGYTV